MVTQLTPLPLAKVTDEGYPVEVTTQLIKFLPPTPQNAVNSQTVVESLFSSHDEIETTSVNQLTELEQPELFGKEVARDADKSMHSETKIARQTPDLGLPKQLPTVTIASNSADIAQSNQPVNKYPESSKRDRFNRTEPQLPKNIDGSDRLPWETLHRGKFDPEFEKWMARSLMQYPAFQNLMAGELLIKVRKHISAGKYDLKRRFGVVHRMGGNAIGCGRRRGGLRRYCTSCFTPVPRSAALFVVEISASPVLVAPDGALT